MTLDELKPGQECQILNIFLEGEEMHRFLDLGFIPGNEVKVIRNAPLLDPFDIKIGSSQIAVRRSEAAFVEVELI